MIRTLIELPFAIVRRVLPASPDPAAGRCIGTAPDPSAAYLPENRRVSADEAAELRRAVYGR